MSALQKNKSTQTSGSVFVERKQKAKKTKPELELIEYVDCFLDGRGSYDSKLVSLKIKSLKRTIYIFFELVRVKSVPKENKLLVRNETPNQKISTIVIY